VEPEGREGEEGTRRGTSEAQTQDQRELKPGTRGLKNKSKRKKETGGIRGGGKDKAQSNRADDQRCHNPWLLDLTAGLQDPPIF
jgi:hypothetical protein